MNCSGDSEEPAVPEVSKPSILLSGGVTPFIVTDVLSLSETKTIEAKGENLTEITETQANLENSVIYVRFTPKESAICTVNGKLTFTSNQASEHSINLKGEGISIAPIININKTSLNFENTEVMAESSSLNLVVNGDNLVTGLDLSVTAGFVISLDDITFTNTLQIPAALANDDTVVYVRFTPSELGSINGVLAFQNAEIDDANTFSHYIGPIGCANNPIAPQGGNWSPDRAGWCPGMGVPIRTDTFSVNQAGKTFTLEYDFQDWTTDGGTTSGQNGAFYSLSQFVVVKSNPSF